MNRANLIECFSVMLNDCFAYLRDCNTGSFDKAQIDILLQNILIVDIKKKKFSTE